MVDKSWEDIINKPDFFEELEKRIVAIMDNAEDIGLLTKATTLKGLKDAINEVLLKPLKEDYSSEESEVIRNPNSILADAFWDEIIKNDDTWDRFKDAVERAFAMKTRIAEQTPLSSKDTLMRTKETFNEAVLKPMLGIDEDE